ncbi:glycosyltransferase family 4 protein [Haloarcula amylovorans]|uniref:glycosyltransferase family 4 protein n=1 Tax=Haloarcula amylovorans TaxID=2562280 RepID=UPI001076A6FC|nr:glycosyltransferase family 4 protein [Halomicroarcula amylolytica]
MRVLYIVGQGEGGLAHYTAELANAVAADHEVVVLKPTETDADDLFGSDVELLERFAPIDLSMPRIYKFDVDPRSVVRGLRSYRNLGDVFDVDPDVVHDPTGLFPQVRYYASRHEIDTAFPFVLTKHEVPKNRFSPARPPVMVEETIHAVLPNVDADRRIVHTPQQRAAMEGWGEDPETISVIPHGAYSVFGNHEDVDDDPEPNTVLFFGNVVPPKGPDTLVEAMVRVGERLPDAKLVIAGDGSLPREQRRLLEAHPERFEFQNRYVPNDEVKDAFARAALVATPYRELDGTKGHSGALTTAFSFGKPVVASTAGDFRRLVGESGAGRVVPPEDPERLADVIVDVLTDERARTEMGEASKAMADRLAWDSIADEHVELYREIQ